MYLLPFRPQRLTIVILDLIEDQTRLRRMTVISMDSSAPISSEDGKMHKEEKDDVSEETSDSRKRVSCLFFEHLTVSLMSESLTHSVSSAAMAGD